MALEPKKVVTPQAERTEIEILAEIALYLNSIRNNIRFFVFVVILAIIINILF